MREAGRRRRHRSRSIDNSRLGVHMRHTWLIRPLRGMHIVRIAAAFADVITSLTTKWHGAQPAEKWRSHRVNYDGGGAAAQHAVMANQAAIKRSAINRFRLGGLRACFSWLMIADGPHVACNESIRHIADIL